MLLTRILTVVILLIVLVFGVFYYTLISRESAQLERISHMRSEEYVQSIRIALETSMLASKPELAGHVIDELNAVGLLRIAVFNSRGERVYGSPDLVAPAPLEEREQIVYEEDRVVYSGPLFNSENCQRCHSGDGQILGAVAMRIPFTAMEPTLGDFRSRLIIAGFILFMTAVLIVLLFVDRIVLSPLALIHRGVEELRGGNLGYRIALHRKDELGSLSDAFDEMSEQISSARENLEHAVEQKTRELRVIAELSSEVFLGDLPLQGIIDRFMDALTEGMGFSAAAFCIVDRETCSLAPEFNRGFDEDLITFSLPLYGDHPFVRAFRTIHREVGKAADMGFPDRFGNIAVSAVVARDRNRCSVVNSCAFTECPAYDSPDERCWIIPDTLCRSPKAVAGREKICGCISCEAFPVIGVLVVAKSDEVSETSLHSVEILSSQIASAIEQNRRVRERKMEIETLIRLHSTAVEKLRKLDFDLIMKEIAEYAVDFANMDAAIVWMDEGGGALVPVSMVNIDPAVVPEGIRLEDLSLEESIIQDQFVESVETAKEHALRRIINRYGFMYLSIIPLNFKGTIYGYIMLFRKLDFLMTEAEKALIKLFGSQADAAIHASKLYEELRRQQEFTDSIFNNISSGIMVIGRDGRLMRLNPAGMDILGIADEEFEGRMITEIFPETAVMLDAKSGTAEDLDFRRSDGTVIPVGYTNSSLLDDDGSVRGHIILFRDLSLIKKLNEETKKKEHFETIARIVAGVAHEIRNPLFGISSIVQILEREVSSEQHQMLLKAMLREIMRLKKIVEELLIYSRPSRLSVSSFDFSILAEKMRQHAESRGEGVVMDERIAPGAVVRGDVDKLTQVFLNVVDNALGAGSKRIRIVHREEESGVTVTVIDDGSGIPAESLGRIYDPFFTTKKDGTGLGLSICRKIIEDHGGSIDVESGEGGGTAVRIFLP